ncbi:MAG: hypothetical protein KatS3mg108_3112 [Isosphaeraceae bacterium]|jgi:hypothetical protein|nr:MAG: hypothetical protein KatS3mg108_3112 [Isosphaeraceae bacterium]
MSVWLRVLGLLICAEVPVAAQDRAVDYAREIEPLLAARCFPCHAAEEHKGGLRLDTREHLLIGGDSGPAIEVGDSGSSYLIEKVSGEDPSPMPPRGKGEPLTKAEVDRLRAWIDQGAPWDGPALTTERAAEVVGRQHWAFRAPERPAVPAVGRRDWARNAIDRFILARLESEGMAPAAEADRATLIRRLSLDLLGLPPTPEAVDAFVADPRPDAYERLVDRLLADPAYGERWGRRWLDLARYADTNGYEKDRERSIWPYRDWVIRAINADLPFDQFTVEQIAGDLLPGATLDQRIATGFHRNTMINEEGGIDVEEFRFAALVDRVATTGTVWLGLTLGCAQCHTHKYDPITQKDYYRLMAMMDNADEPEIDVPDPEIERRRRELLAEIEERESRLAERFPLPDPAGPWRVVRPLDAVVLGEGEKVEMGLEVRGDGSVVALGPAPERVTYAVRLEEHPEEVAQVRLEALPDESLPRTGPGRAPNGNYVVTGVRLALETADGRSVSVVPIESVEADYCQDGFTPAGVLDADRATGWAIDDGSGRLNRRRVLTLALREPIPAGAGRLHVVLEQNYGGRHTLGRFRMSVRGRPKPVDPGLSEARLRARHLEERQREWEASLTTADWVALAPTKVLSRKHATMEVMEDASVLVSGDKPNNDVYELEVEIPAGAEPVTGLRIEALTHPSHPEGGPGRAPLFSVGDFILTEVEARVRGGQAIRFAHASHDYAEPGKSAALAIDGQPDTGWSIRGGVGRPHHVVLELAEPLGREQPLRLELVLHQFGIHQMTLGRFRVSYTTTAGPLRSSGVPAEVEAALRVAEAERDDAQRELIRRAFLAGCEELEEARGEIEALRRRLPRHPTTLVMQERRPEHRRVTRVRERGEFLRAAERVEPGVPAALHRLPAGVAADRLGLARWLVSRDNPLVARVVVNRDWLAFFGRGLVTTVEDFGSRGERPTHPELLDWLAVEFMDRGWSRKQLHRLIVTSATYRQDSRVSAEALARDPKNALYARGARLRFEAEVVRDVALAAAGLLDRRIGGPSVYPPQPEGVTSLAYGGPGWPTSTGPDRYRRGLYTFTKRTAPYAMFSTFDMPTSEATCARRERSNTPLQSLTLLNDLVFLEAARALAARVMREAADLDARIDRMAMLVLGRHSRELKGFAERVREFSERQRQRLEAGELVAKELAAETPTGLDPVEHAMWTAVARVVLNLDRAITRD